MPVDPLRAAADTHVLPCANLVLASISAARDAVPLLALEAALARRDTAGAGRATDAAVEAMEAVLVGDEEKATRRPGLRDVLSGAMASGARATELCVVATRAEAARATHKPVDNLKRIESAKSEATVARAIGGKDLSDNEPMDVIVRKGDRLFGVEVKTFIDTAHSKVTMHPESLAKKKAWLREHKATGYTVVVDKRGASPKYYVADGFGSFRIGRMRQVTLEELARLFR